MLQTLEAIVILIIIWQAMTRFKKRVRLSSDAKTGFQNAIQDAQDRLPSTGLFKLFKAKSNIPQNIEEPKIEIEKSIIPAKGAEEKD